MELKKYLCVDAENITLIDYVFVDYNVDERYPKPNSISIGGDTSVKIFEKNGIPKEYQKIYMECNAVKMIVNEINNKFLPFLSQGILFKKILRIIITFDYT